ncbi:sensor histidine kinase [Mariniradius sediminis]|uniref:histidine kinase n=1 Tax=Mariniradius sediminis TaxID=2909237 RepID=A0ABS9BR11_9BACT|nr:ATP-binding protein [Mariniradius sediminis]MCF1749780.1 ATP-binding protein [Mariniradius sediminis]
MQDEGSDLFLIILLGFFLMLLMVSFIVLMLLYHRQKQIKNRERLKAIQTEYEKTILNVEKEIREDVLAFVGRELHDNVGQLLSLAKLNLSSTKPEKISDGKNMLNDIIREVRSLSKALNLDWVETISLEDFIKRELEKIGNLEFCTVDFASDGPSLTLSKDQKLVLFRIIQECLNNAIKHAQPSMIAIEINAGKSPTEILIKDDGKGFDLRQQSNGQGLRNLQYRMETIGGKLELIAAPGKGTQVKLLLPN